jgi:hypothetical protein
VIDAFDPTWKAWTLLEVPCPKSTHAADRTRPPGSAPPSVTSPTSEATLSSLRGISHGQVGRHLSSDDLSAFSVGNDIDGWEGWDLVVNGALLQADVGASWA